MTTWALPFTEAALQEASDNQRPYKLRFRLPTRHFCFDGLEARKRHGAPAIQTFPFGWQRWEYPDGFVLFFDKDGRYIAEAWQAAKRHEAISKEDLFGALDEVFAELGEL
jgi:hypothetical protein